VFSQNTIATGVPLNAVTSNGSVPIRFFPLNVGVVPIRRRGSKFEREFGAAQELDEASFVEHASAARAEVGAIANPVKPKVMANAGSQRGRE